MMKHKILCTIKSAIYYAGFKGSFLNGPGVKFYLSSLLCSTDWLLRSQKKEQGKSENRIPAGCCVINTVRCDHLVIALWSTLTGCRVFTVQCFNYKWHSVSHPRGRLAIIIGGFHFEDVRDDAVNLHVANEPSEKQLLGDSCTYQPEGRKTQQQLG